jgi:hypothetical protein
LPGKSPEGSCPQSKKKETPAECKEILSADRKGVKALRELAKDSEKKVIFVLESRILLFLTIGTFYRKTPAGQNPRIFSTRRKRAENGA